MKYPDLTLPRGLRDVIVSFSTGMPRIVDESGTECGITFGFISTPSRRDNYVSMDDVWKYNVLMAPDPEQCYRDEFLIWFDDVSDGGMSLKNNERPVNNGSKPILAPFPFKGAPITAPRRARDVSI